jgi:hypothetical protein
MINHNFYCEFITTFHKNYNGKCLRPWSWCHTHIERENGYVEFIKRQSRYDIDTTFFAKYDFTKEEIIIKCEYEYFANDCPEVSEANFRLIDYKKNDYNGINIHGTNVNFLADQEILTFIKMFDQFYLEQKDKDFTQEEFNLYMRHLKLKPELTKNYSSKNCDFNLDFYYSEQAFVIRFNYHDKKYNKYDMFEYILYKNRTLGDDFNDLNNNLDFEIAQRFDDIHIDFMTFVELRLN